MRYIFPEKAIRELNKLRKTYEKERQVDLAAKPSAIGMPIILGGVDVVARNAQIEFLEKILKILGPNLKKFERDISEQELKARLEARRIAYKLCLVACWYVQSQTHTIANGSVLSKIIDRCLQITKKNYYEAADKVECFLTADRLVNTAKALDEANTRLTTAGLTPFSELEWKGFTSFISQNQPKDKAAAAVNNYPITSITQPLFGKVFSYAGLTMGFLSGDVISQSSKAMSSRAQLTAAIGGSIFLMGPAGPSGLALFAPVIASKLITGFCSVTLAKIMGKSMELLGNGVGTAVGIPLDVSCRLLTSFCSIVGGYCSPDLNNDEVMGLRIGDGALMFCGIPMSYTSDTALKGTKLKRIELKEDGSVLIDGKPLLNAKGELMLTADVQQKLKDQYTQDLLEITGDTDAVVEEDSTAVTAALSPA